MGSTLAGQVSCDQYRAGDGVSAVCRVWQMEKSSSKLLAWQAAQTPRDRLEFARLQRTSPDA